VDALDEQIAMLNLYLTIESTNKNMKIINIPDDIEASIIMSSILRSASCVDLFIGMR
jgi:hypothetical protein